jgi:hypothetical protein
MFHITFVVNGAQARHSMARGGTAASLDETDSWDGPEDDLLDDEFAGSLAGSGSRFPAASGPKAEGRLPGRGD